MVALVPLLCFAGSFLLHDDPKITYSTAGKSVKAVMRDLTQKTGLDLRANASTASEILTIDVHDVLLSDLMKQIATSVTGDWVRDGDTEYLGRDPGQVRNEERAFHDKQIDQFRKLMQKRNQAVQGKEFDQKTAEELADRFDKMVKAFSPAKNNWGDSQDMNSRGPIGRAITEILNQLDADDLLSQTKQIRYVYSTNPTASQRPFPFDASAVMAELGQNRRIWLDAASGRHLHNPTFGNITYLLSDLGQDLSEDGQQPSVMLFSATRWSDEVGMSLKLSLYDTKGKRILESNEYLSAENEPAKATPTTKTDSSPRLEIPAIYKDYLRSTQGQGTRLSPEERDALRQALLKPEELDPVASLSGPILVEAAQGIHKNLVADVPDSGVYLYNFDTGSPPTARGFIDQSLPGIYKVNESDDWLVLQPHNEMEQRGVQADRHVLGELLRETADSGVLSLEQRAAFALQLPAQRDNGLPDNLERAVSTDNQPYMDENALRFYGCLSEGQRQAATRKQLTYGSLDADQKAILDYIIYGDNAWLNQDPSPQGDQGNFWDSIRREPTVLAPDGVPSNQLIVMTDSGESCVFPADPGQPSWTQTQGMSAQTLAWNLYSQAHPDKFPWALQNGQVPFRSFRQGRQRTVSFQIYVNTGYFLTSALQENHLASGDPVAFDDLPADFKKQVTDTMDSYAKSYANGNFFGGGTTVTASP